MSEVPEYASLILMVTLIESNRKVCPAYRVQSSDSPSTPATPGAAGPSNLPQTPATPASPSPSITGPSRIVHDLNYASISPYRTPQTPAPAIQPLRGQQQAEPGPSQILFAPVQPPHSTFDFRSYTSRTPSFLSNSFTQPMVPSSSPLPSRVPSPTNQS